MLEIDLFLTDVTNALIVKDNRAGLKIRIKRNLISSTNLLSSIVATLALSKIEYY
jgi:hypothetical protein